MLLFRLNFGSKLCKFFLGNASQRVLFDGSVDPKPVLFRKITKPPGRYVASSSPTPWMNYKQKQYIQPFKYIIRPDGTVLQKKIQQTPKVTLIHLNGVKSSVYLEQAEKLAKHAGLHLIRQEDDGDKPTYRLMRGSELFLSDHRTTRRQSKSNKVKIISGSQDHDVMLKINHINKLLDKGRYVTVFVERESESKERIDQIIDKICSKIASGCIINEKLEINSGVFFKILPHKEMDENDVLEYLEEDSE